MRVVRLITIIALGLLALAGLLVTRQRSTPSQPAPRMIVASASWIHPTSLADLRRKTDLAVTATVVRVRPGQPLTNPRLGRDDQPLPTQLVTLRVDKLHRGNAPATVQVFRTGGTLPDGTTLVMSEDAPYRVGQQYLLLLRRGAPQSSTTPVGPEGRLLRDSSGLFSSMEQGTATGRALQVVREADVNVWVRGGRAPRAAQAASGKLHPHPRVYWSGTGGNFHIFAGGSYTVPVRYALSSYAGSSGLTDQVKFARYAWDVNVNLSLPVVSSGERMLVSDGYYGNTGWGGLASLSNCNPVISGWAPCSYGTVQLNQTAFRLSWYSSGDRLGTTCQEIGHILGQNHSPGSCMG